jgi:hypothetical protein
VVGVDADSAVVVDHLRCTLPPGGGWQITCSLQQEDQLLATNQYDLSIHDGIRPTPFQRLRNWLVDQAIRRTPMLDRLFGADWWSSHP